MKQLIFILLTAGFFALVTFFWIRYRNWTENQRESEARLASAMAEMMKAKPASAAVAVDAAGLAQQKLLYEAAAKAGEAGEAVLSIQLYARLLARFPNTTFGAQARAAVEAQKKKLVKT
jgi:formate hydrogenlyase subunit 3/multisubunit Na+/H+ antiporter MnhD subunit